MHSSMHLNRIKGEASRVKKDATAWTYRDATWTKVIVGVDPDPANKKMLAAWARDYWDALHLFSTGGA